MPATDCIADRACVACGKPTPSKAARGPKRKYCSRQCRNGNFRTLSELACKACGKTFKPDSLLGPPPKFCGAECRNGYHNSSASLTCQGCGSTYTGSKGSRYCSTKCWPRVQDRYSETRTCKECGKRYEQAKSHTNRFYCSKACMGRGNLKVARLVPRNDRKKVKACLQCGSEFRGIKADRYCSTDCEAKSKQRHCDVCGNSFESTQPKARFCSTECSSKHYGSEYWAVRRKAVYVYAAGYIECPECDQVVYLDRNATRKRYCSEACAKKARKRIERHRRRRRINSGKSEIVTLRFLYKRDKGVCQICRKPVDRTLKVPDLMAPVRDHVIPVAKGGTETKLNMQLAHFICNSEKSDRVDTLF